ncbi:hypothetical protein SXCC_00780 [Gluconacetobacter sp. SXCC-1]|nr:hypothetical protein SXCC_00780 [Gluconacetobacter sp. SXCC-1]KDU95953.1 hypothetical protein GLUCORHAEAF1_05355 [Komagataeibacter rhaeticus AF1]
MTLHPDAKRSALAKGELFKPIFCQRELWKETVGKRQEPLSRLSEHERASFTLPYLHAKLAFQLADGMTKRRLGQIEARSCSRQ